MEVICLESAALTELVKLVVTQLKKDAPAQETEWIDGIEAMELLNCKKTKLQELRSMGKIEYSKPSKKIILYKRSSILDFLKKHTQSTF